MMDTSSAGSRQNFRTDALTGGGNLLAFLDCLTSNFNLPTGSPLSLISLDLNHLARLEHSKGDAVLRWVALVLAEETGARVFRIGGDEFILALTEGAHSDHAALAEAIFCRLNAEVASFGLNSPAATVVVVHYDGQELLSPPDVLCQLDAAITAVKTRYGRTFKAFQAAEMKVADQWIFKNMVYRVIELGEMLEESHHLAYTDPVTGLPNMRAALQQLETAVAQAGASGQSFAILLIDGDDLGRYNKISYAAGDEMIQRLGSTLKGQLRPRDFLARWRIGDEFLALLPDTALEQALIVGQRFCCTVEQASTEWILPVTISVGIAVYPEHGAELSDLLHQAEKANDVAKASGKNRVSVAR